MKRWDTSKNPVSAKHNRREYCDIISGYIGMWMLSLPNIFILLLYYQNQKKIYCGFARK
jgi:hypothetical protein